MPILLNKQLKDTMSNKKNQGEIMQNEKPPKPKDIEKYSQKRKVCDELSDSFKRLGFEGKATRISNCGTQLTLAYIFAEDRMQLHRANFCRERLCPMCAMQRTGQIFGQVSQVMNEIQRERPELTPIFLTLTLRNCKADQLSTTLDAVFQGWNRMFSGNSKLKRVVTGWFRALEITYNEQEDSYHPHIHAILLVPPGYFTTPKDYMTNEKWVKSWRRAVRLDYDPSCRIQAIDAAADERAGAVAEVAKYTVKDADYIKADEALTDKLVSIFNSALKGRRLYAFGGLMKEIAKRLKLDFGKLEPGEVTDKNGVPLRKDIDYVLLFYRWNVGLSRYDFDGKV